jgi:integrase
VARRNKSGIRGLYKTADGEWRIDYRWCDPTTGQKKRHAERLEAGTTAAAAKARALKIINAAAAGTFNPRQQQSKTLGKALDDYITWAETNRPRSIESKRSQAKVLKAKLGENTRLDSLSVFSIERFKRDRAEGLRKAAGEDADDYTGAASVNRALATLKHMIGLAVEWGWMSEIAARGVRSVKLMKEPPGRVRHLASDETAKLEAKLPAGIKAIVRAAAWSGIDSVSRAFSRAVRKAGLSDVRFHDTRHTFATEVRRRGAGIDVVQELLGHATIAMSQRYAHINDSMLHAAVAGIGGNRPPISDRLPTTG